MVNKVDVEGICKYFGIQKNGHVFGDIVLDEPDSIGDNFFGEIGAEQSKKLEIIKAITSIGLNFKNFQEIIQKALPIERWFTKRTIRFQDNMFPFIALIQVLWYSMMNIQIILG